MSLKSRVKAGETADVASEYFIPHSEGLRKGSVAFVPLLSCFCAGKAIVRKWQGPQKTTATPPEDRSGLRSNIRVSVGVGIVDRRCVREVWGFVEFAGTLKGAPISQYD